MEQRAINSAFQATPINSVLQNFDQLPDSAMVRLPIVKGLLNVSGATVWRLVKAGKLKTYKLSERTTTFNVGELKKFLTAKASV
jgi:hypothetical protein